MLSGGTETQLLTLSRTGDPQTQKRSLQLVHVFAVLVLLGVSLYWLPFRFPTAHATVGVAYMVGYNNRAASVCVMALAFASLIASVWTVGAPKAGLTTQYERMRWMPLILAAFAYILLNGALGFLIARTHQFGLGEPAYFLVKLYSMLNYGQHPYRDFELLYGPSMVYVPYWVAKCLQSIPYGTELAYYSCVLVFHVAGLGVLFWTLNRLAMRRSLKLTLFLTWAFFNLNPSVGLQYTCLRFAALGGLLVLLGQQRTLFRFVGVASLGVLAELSLSAEMGVAFGAGVTAFAVLQAVMRRRVSWLLAIAGMAIAAGGFLAIAGRSYFESVSSFSSGYFNFVPLPSPFLIVYLLALLVVAPMAVAPAIRNRGAQAPLLLAFYVSSVMLVPAALGRTDPQHVYTVGLALLCLSFLAVGSLPPWGRNIWSGLVLLGAVWAQLGLYSFYRKPLGNILRTNLGFASSESVSENWFSTTKTLIADVLKRPALPLVEDPTDAELLRVVGTEKVETPGGVLEPTLLQLMRLHRFAPEHNYSFWLVSDEAVERRKIAEMRRSNVVIGPRDMGWFEGQDVGCSLNNICIKFPEIRTPYVPGLLVEQELKTNWREDGMLGPYYLWRKKSPKPAGNKH